MCILHNLQNSRVVSCTVTAGPGPKLMGLGKRNFVGLNGFLRDFRVSAATVGLPRGGRTTATNICKSLTHRAHLRPRKCDQKVWKLYDSTRSTANFSCEIFIITLILPGGRFRKLHILYILLGCSIHQQNIQGPCILGDLYSQQWLVCGLRLVGKGLGCSGAKGAKQWVKSTDKSFGNMNRRLLQIMSLPKKTDGKKKDLYIHPPKQPKNDESTSSWWSLLAGIASGGGVPRHWWRFVTSIPFKDKLGRFMLQHIGALLQWKS